MIEMPTSERILPYIMLIGVLLLVTILYIPELDISLAASVYIIASFLFLTTFALGLFTSAEPVFYIVSLLRTQRFIAFIERISKFKAWDFLADMGLVVGFGALAVDYLYGRKYNTAKRLLVAIISILFLFIIFFLTLGSFFVSPKPDAALFLTIFSLAFALGGMMLFAIVALVWQGIDIITKMAIGRTPCPGVAPIIPGVQMPNVPAALTPPVYIWIAFVILLIVHEFSHGALIKRANAKIKSVGLLLAGIFPIGAFVEPDEEELKTKPDRQQLRVYAMGPAANLFSIPVFIAIFLIASLSVGIAIDSWVSSQEKAIPIESLVITEISDDYDVCGETIKSPAKGVLEVGWIVRQYNGISLDNVHNLRNALGSADKNISLLLETQDSSLIEKTLEKNTYGRLGTQMKVKYPAGFEPPFGYLIVVLLEGMIQIFFAWLLLLSFAIAVVNFLPIEPFDGGKIAKIMLVPYFGFIKMGRQETEKFIGRFFLWIITALLLLNAMPLLL